MRLEKFHEGMMIQTKWHPNKQSMTTKIILSFSDTEKERSGVFQVLPLEQHRKWEIESKRPLRVQSGSLWWLMFQMEEKYLGVSILVCSAAEVGYHRVGVYVWWEVFSSRRTKTHSRKVKMIKEEWSQSCRCWWLHALGGRLERLRYPSCR